MSYSVGVPLLLLLEGTFIFTVLALLFHQRRNIGKAPFAIAFSALCLLTALAMGADIQAHLFGGLFFSVPKAVMFPPVLAVYLMIYITEGTLSAQRLIYGLLVLGGILIYMAEMIYLQCSWSSFSLSADLSGSALETLLSSAKNALRGTAIPVLFSTFAVPIIYSALRERKFFRTPSIIVALAGVRLLLIVPDWLIQLGAGTTPEWFNGDQLAGLLMDFWLGGLLGIYLKLTESEEVFSRPERPLDIVFAFFGSYGRSKELAQNLSDWQNRYRLILHNASEIIIVFDGENRVREANLAARRIFGEAAANGSESLLGCFSSPDPADFTFDSPVAGTKTCRCVCTGEDGGTLNLFVSWDAIMLNNEEYRILIARDITGEMKLLAEKKLLAEQLAHSQRLESLGVLAGGVAHDFNNYIHAILGNVDLALLIGGREKKWTDKIADHLNKIVTIAEKAGELTRQLLGFARRGNYVETDFDPAKLFKATFDLVGPKKMSQVQVTAEAEENRFLIHGDQLQLQQVLVNIVINALYAMEHNAGERRLGIRLFSAAELPDEKCVIPPGLKGGSRNKGDFCCIAVTDNGSGMEKETIAKIFEPFFTTKPQGEGSGMGLSMAYGIVTNCGGWIDVESAPGAGSTFRLFLPDLKHKEQKLS